ncbi:hypothetical protein [Colwellia sp. TT2012]|uniref:hypothetical protein n=1 Tax=Colwellia sp. TT2012 TaxID=1720342 RepID=UPI000A459198|nr:hypothetical protein [Colwellia sp. TT2012]
MQLSTALSQVSQNNFTEFTALSELLEPNLVADALAQSGVAKAEKNRIQKKQKTPL